MSILHLNIIVRNFDSLRINDKLETSFKTMTKAWLRCKVNRWRTKPAYVKFEKL